MVNEIASRCKNPQGKYMPILFNEKAHDLVPFGLRGTLCYTWPKHCKMIISVMKGEQQISPSAVGEQKFIPPTKTLVWKEGDLY